MYEYVAPDIRTPSHLPPSKMAMLRLSRGSFGPIGQPVCAEELLTSIPFIIRARDTCTFTIRTKTPFIES
jgi:hypothetical protein